MLAVVAVFSGLSNAQNPAGGIPAPPSEINAVDVEGDKGEAIEVYWRLSPNDPSASAMPDLNTDTPAQVEQYTIYRRLADGADEFTEIGTQTYGVSTFTDSNVEEGVSYIYGVAADSEAGSSELTVMVYPVAAVMQWFDHEKM